jgi:hypothetical protein
MMLHSRSHAEWLIHVGAQRNECRGAGVLGSFTTWPHMHNHQLAIEGPHRASSCCLSSRAIQQMQLLSNVAISKLFNAILIY